MDLLRRLRGGEQGPGDQLRRLLRAPGASVQEVTSLLADLDHDGRLAAVRALGFAHQRVLFDCVEGHRALTIDDLVPPERGVRATVRHHGKNSMPAFSLFEKRMLRPVAGGTELWGYNHQTMSPVSGPGYFVAYDALERGEVDIDYTRVPDEQPAGWPAPAPNERGLSNLIYGNMVDVLRGVADRVTVGRAFWKGVAQPNYFVLCRE